MVPGLNSHRTTIQVGIAALMVIAFLFLPFTAIGAELQQGFSSPEEGGQALISGCAKNDVNQLIRIFGDKGKDLIVSGDDTADREGRARLVAAAQQLTRYTSDPQGRVFLNVGKDDWPFPIPLVKKNGLWYFDTEQGTEELINRRIGRNEIAAQLSILAFVDAQKEYYSQDRDGDGVKEYARKFASSPGQKDGLFWPAKEGEEESPLGPLAAKAVREGYSKKKKGSDPEPYHGYLFKILTTQGKAASGGIKNYVVKGNMTRGFALVAYPAQYGVSGIMTFIANQDGIIYQKDLGKKTGAAALSIMSFNPDKSWKKVDHETLTK